MKEEKARKLAQEMANRGLVEIVSSTHAWYVCSTAQYAAPASPISEGGIQRGSNDLKLMAYAKKVGANYLFGGHHSFYPYVVINNESLEKLIAQPIDNTLRAMVSMQLFGTKDKPFGKNTVTYKDITLSEYSSHLPEWFSNAVRKAEKHVVFRTEYQTYSLKHWNDHYEILEYPKKWKPDKKKVKQALKLCGIKPSLNSESRLQRGYNKLVKKNYYQRVANKPLKIAQELIASPHVLDATITVTGMQLTTDEIERAPWPAYKIVNARASTGEKLTINVNLLDTYHKDKEYFKKHFQKASEAKKKNILQTLIDDNGVEFNTDIEDWLSEKYPELCQTVGMMQI